jgi:hypothetical protein
MATPLCFLATETDGLHSGRQAWDIAIIRRDPDGTQTEHQFFVEIDLSTADPKGLRIGKFYDRHPIGRHIAHRDSWSVPSFERVDHKSARDAAFAVAQLTHGAHIVGAVPSFDTDTLDPLLRRHGLIPAWHYHLIDIEVLALGYLAATRNEVIHPPYRSDDLTLALGLDPAPPEDRHTALGDARWAMRMYDAVMSGNALHHAVTESIDA